MHKYLATILLSAILAACATPQTRSPEVTSVAAEIEAKKQRELAAQALLEAERRLYTVGYPLLMRGMSLCGDKVSPSVGMIFWNSYHFEKEWQDALKSRYGVTDLVQVSYTAPGSPAEKAGIRAGDVPISLSGWPVPVGENALKEFRSKLDEHKQKGGPIELIVRRGNEDMVVSVIPEPACDFMLVLANEDSKNAYADGRRIVVHRGLMDFFKTDEEAALVIAHELAHNSMGHINAKVQNATIGGLIGLLFDVAAAAGGVNTQGQFSDLGAKAGAAAYSVEFEQEADYVGLYLMALGGYQIDGAADFWRRMAIQDPRSIQLRGTHPTTPERFVGIEKTVAEIKEKIARGAPLEPELKKENNKKKTVSEPESPNRVE